MKRLVMPKEEAIARIQQMRQSYVTELTLAMMIKLYGQEMEIEDVREESNKETTDECI